MTQWPFYTVIVATIISVISLTSLTLKYKSEQPRTLSELAAAEGSLLQQFKKILLFCGTLFAIAMFGYIAPKLHPAILAYLFSALMIGGEILSALVPAQNKTVKLHELLAKVMATGMLALAYLFYFDLAGSYKLVEFIFASLMSAFALLTFIDKKRFVIYELSFIFVFHFSILLAAANFLQ